MSVRFDRDTYMASREWRLKRKEIMAKTEGWCGRCHSAKATQVHHLSYKHLGDEPLDELAALCKDCHLFVSAESGHDPRLEALWREFEQRGLRPQIVDGKGISWVLSWDTGPLPSGWTFHCSFKTTPQLDDFWDELERFYIGVLEVEPGIWLHCEPY